MLNSFAHRFIIEKNICAPAMRNRPRLRWKNDANRPRGEDVGVGVIGESGTGSAMYAVDEEEAISKWGVAEN